MSSFQKPFIKKYLFMWRRDVPGHYVEIKGQPAGASSVLLPCGFQGSNSGYQGWCKCFNCCAILKSVSFYSRQPRCLLASQSSSNILKVYVETSFVDSTMLSLLMMTVLGHLLGDISRTQEAFRWFCPQCDNYVHL